MTRRDAAPQASGTHRAVRHARVVHAPARMETHRPIAPRPLSAGWGE